MQEICQVSDVMKGVEPLSDDTLGLAEDLFYAETRRDNACLLAALRNRRIGAAGRMAQNLDEAWSR